LTPFLQDEPTPLPSITVEEPTVRMSISVNKSPLAGREGKLLQSRVIRDRLFKELDRNVALKVRRPLSRALSHPYLAPYLAPI